MKTLLQRLRHNDGFSLVEVVVAVAIIGALVAVMASLLAQAARSQNRLIEMRAANNMMQTEVAAMDSTPWDDLMLKPVGAASVCDLTGSSTRTSAQVVKPNDTLVLDNVNFTVTRNVQWYTGGQQVTCLNTPNDRNDIKVVTVTLTWYPDSNGAATRSSTLYVSKNKDQITTSHIRAFTTSAVIGIPDEPTALASVGAAGQVALTWSVPASNGGTPITDYIVQYRTSPSGTWTTFNDGTSTSAGATVTGLTNGVTYDFQVAAVNSAGTGTYSTPSTATTVTVPDPPTGLTATPGSTQVSLSWTAPAFNGGAAIIDYVIQYKQGAGSWATFADGTSTSTAAIVTGLVNGNSYTFQVAAVNSVNTGLYTSSPAIATPATAPDAPTGLTGTPSDGQVNLTWTAPVVNGGAAITDYVIRYRIGAGGWTNYADPASAATAATASSFANGTTYDFQVAAVNSAGTGSFSNVFTTTPYGVPDAPTITSAPTTYPNIAIVWTAPAFNGGSAILDYTVTSSSGSTCTATAPTLTCSINGLTNNTSYTYTVKARNAAGSSAASAPVSATSTSLYNLATGGVISAKFQVGGTGPWYQTHTFTSNGTFALTWSVKPYDVLMVGGGGGAYTTTAVASDHGGGGAGGVLAGTITSAALVANNYPITIGTGGGSNTNGTTSTFNGCTATGGVHATQTGGSSSQTLCAAITGSTTYSYSGGSYGGGIGGGGGAGANGSGSGGGTGGGAGYGGAGRVSNITGSNVTYAKGGDGCWNTGLASNGTYGGGGQGLNSSGLSGVVIIRYEVAP